MKKRVIFSLAAVFLAVSLPVFAGGGAQDGSTVINTKNVKFTSENGTLTINNQASFDVIIFGGKVENGNIMGGVRSGDSRSFNISKLPLPGKKGCFLVRAVSVDAYNKKKIRVAEEDVVFSGLVVYDLTDSGDRTNLNIYKGIDQTQSSFIYATNNSSFVLELRLGTPTGEKIATLPPQLENKKIWINPLPDGMPYRFWATYVYIDPKTNEMTSIAPKNKKSSDQAYPDTDSSNITPMIFAGPASNGDIGYNVAFIRLNNGSTEGIQFRNANTFLPDQKGIRFTASGRQALYELPATSGDSGQVYTSLLLQFSKGDEIVMDKTPPIALKPGYQYDLSVTNDKKWDIRETGQKNKLDDARISLFGD